jgi:hypothetical protein
VGCQPVSARGFRINHDGGELLGLFAILKFAAKAWYLVLMFALAFALIAVLAAPLAGFPVHSRLGKIISRFARKKFPVPMPRELSGKHMVILMIFRRFRPPKGGCAAIPGYFPGSREFRPSDPGLKSTQRAAADGRVARIGPGVFPVRCIAR